MRYEITIRARLDGKTVTMSPRAWFPSRPAGSRPAGDDPEVEALAWRHCQEYGATLVSIESIRELSDCRYA